MESHRELLNLLCRYREVLDQGYREGSLGTPPPPELLERGLFFQIGSRFYLNTKYRELMDLLLRRVPISATLRPFREEVEQLKRYRKLYLEGEKGALPLFYQTLLGLVIKYQEQLQQLEQQLRGLERNPTLSLRGIVQEGQRLLEGSGEFQQQLLKTQLLLEEWERELPRLEGELPIGGARRQLIQLARQLEGVLRRLGEFVTLQEQRRRFNQQLFRVAEQLRREEPQLLRLIATLPAPTPVRVTPLPDPGLIAKERVREYLQKPLRRPVGELELPSPPPPTPLPLFDLPRLKRDLVGTEDLFLSIYTNPQLTQLPPPLRLQSTFRLFFRLIRELHPNLEWTNRGNQFRVRVLKWRK